MWAGMSRGTAAGLHTGPAHAIHIQPAGLRKCPETLPVPQAGVLPQAWPIGYM